MEAIAKLKNLRISARKVRLVADLIRRKKIDEAQAILNFTVKRGSSPLAKLLDSAVANAKNIFQADPKNLFISKITVDEGTKLKRWMPRARGTAYQIQKKTSHITIVLGELKETPKSALKRKKATKIAKKTSETKEEQKPLAAEEPKEEKPKIKNIGLEKEILKPKTGKGVMNKIFRRKAF